jgi:hypothetical protein
LIPGDDEKKPNQKNNLYLVRQGNNLEGKADGFFLYRKAPSTLKPSLSNYSPQPRVDHHSGLGEEMIENIFSKIIQQKTMPGEFIDINLMSH